MDQAELITHVCVDHNLQRLRVTVGTPASVGFRRAARVLRLLASKIRFLSVLVAFWTAQHM